MQLSLIPRKITFQVRVPYSLYSALRTPTIVAGKTLHWQSDRVALTSREWHANLQLICPTVTEEELEPNAQQWSVCEHDFFNWCIVLHRAHAALNTASASSPIITTLRISEQQYSVAYPQEMQEQLIHGNWPRVIYASEAYSLKERVHAALKACGAVTPFSLVTYGEIERCEDCSCE